jgi:hypothetical protein
MILEEFLITSFQDVKGKERVNRLHAVLLDELLNTNPRFAEYNWMFEQRLKNDAFGGTFDLDIVGYDNEGNIKVVILDKAYQSSVNKNIKNYANTTIGESARLYYSPECTEIENILFINVMPRIAPMFTKAGKVKGFDDVMRAKNRTKIDDVLQTQYQGVVKSIDLYYDIDDVKNKSAQSEFMEITPKNITPMPVI